MDNGCQEKFERKPWDFLKQLKKESSTSEKLYCILATPAEPKYFISSNILEIFSRRKEGATSTLVIHLQDYSATTIKQ